AIIVPIARYYRDPDRIVKDYLAELERGNSVTLIGETEEPRWQKLVIGQGSIVGSPANDGVFSVSASPSHDAYWELLPVSRGRGCRFRVQVRVERLQRDGAVGVLFARTDFPVAGGTEHCYCVLVISESRGKLMPDLRIVRGLVPGRQRVSISAELTHPHE